MSQVKITYLYNSGFAIEINERLLIFDYCLMTSDDENKNLKSGMIGKDDLKGKSQVTVFVTHGHKDHFNAAILRLKMRCKNIKFIFSEDIPAKNDAILVKAGEFLQVNDMNIWTFPSTDIGVSFFVEVDGITIFHAGDLNIWSCVTNSEMEFRKAKFAYMKALRAISIKKPLDIAFFPLDPRIGENYDIGACYFVNIFHPKLFVPMHFEKRYDVCIKFSEKMKVDGMKVWNIERRGHQYDYFLGKSLRNLERGKL